MMGFSFKKIGKSLLKTGGISLLWPGAEDVSDEIVKGVGNVATFGGLAQAKATAEAKKARDQAQKQYAAETAAAQETARKIAETEEERKRRLAAQGTQMPSTLVGSYLGIPGRVNQSRSLLG
jgi:hypothetical protein